MVVVFISEVRFWFHARSTGPSLGGQFQYRHQHASLEASKSMGLLPFFMFPNALSGLGSADAWQRRSKFKPTPRKELLLQYLECRRVLFLDTGTGLKFLNWKDGEFYADAARTAAAFGLGFLGAIEAVATLRQTLSRDSKEQVRCAAAWALGELGDATAAPELVEALLETGASESLRVAAAAALGQTKAPAAGEALMQVLEAPEPSVRRAAAVALGLCAHRPGSAKLLALLGDSSLEVRLAAAGALTRMPDASAADACLRLISDAVRGPSAAEHVYELGAFGAEVLGSIQYAPAAPILVEAVLSHASASQLLATHVSFSYLRTPKQRLFVEAAAAAIVAIGSPSVELLRPYLLSPDYLKVRLAATLMRLMKLQPSNDEAGAAYLVATGNASKCTVLGRVAGRPLADALKFLIDGSEWQSLEPATDLGDVFPAAERQQRRDKSVVSIIETLVAIGCPCGPVPFVHALGDVSWKIARAAATALSNTPSEVALRALLSALEHGTTIDARVAAATALGHLGDSRAASSLMQALRDDDYAVHAAAAQSLVEVADDSAVGDLLQVLHDPALAPSRRAMATLALAKFGTKAVVQQLLSALGEDDRVMRIRAAQALGRIGAAAAFGPLCGAVGDMRADVSEAAALALLHVPGDGAEAIDALMRRILAGQGAELVRLAPFAEVLGPLFQSAELNLEMLKWLCEVVHRPSECVTEDNQNRSGAIEAFAESWRLESVKAVKRLCACEYRGSSNILILIADFDATIDVACEYIVWSGKRIDGEIGGRRALDFTEQRALAMQEIAKRGNPSYNPRDWSAPAGKDLKL